jgi:hypothetical protein
MAERLNFIPHAPDGWLLQATPPHETHVLRWQLRQRDTPDSNCCTKAQSFFALRIAIACSP